MVLHVAAARCRYPILLKPLLQETQNSENLHNGEIIGVRPVRRGSRAGGGRPHRTAGAPKITKTSFPKKSRTDTKITVKIYKSMKS